MANIKSAKKRILTNNKKYLINKDLKSSMNTYIKKVEKNIQENNAEESKKNYNIAVKKIDKVCAKGIIKKNTAARKKSNLSKKISQLNGK